MCSGFHLSRTCGVCSPKALKESSRRYVRRAPTADIGRVREEPRERAREREKDNAEAMCLVVALC